MTTRLELYFVGGTVFRKLDGSYTAVQLSGKGSSHGGHPMEHRSFLIAPAGTFGAAAQKFPANYAIDQLHPDLKGGAARYEAVCLIGRDIQVSHTGGPPITYTATEVAHYGHIATAWQPKGSWDPRQDRAVNSRFMLPAGELVDAPAVNKKGHAAKWAIGSGPKKTLSDVAKLNLSADSIGLKGIGQEDFTVPAGSPLKLYVFAGPDAHSSRRKYREITHALLLKTIYDVKGTPDADIMPTSDEDVETEPQVFLQHPCDFGKGDAAAPLSLKVPPDSEYCANYQELP